MSFRILIVDDSRSMRNMIRRIITLSGLDTAALLEAGDGVEALEVIDREWVDVILTDINMPRMDGQELIHRLADAGITKSVPVIVVSTDATAMRRDKVVALGARGYLVKPFLPEALKDEIERVMGAAHAM